ncbi:MAG: S1C family serine protease [Sarcina sp.]
MNDFNNNDGMNNDEKIDGGLSEQYKSYNVESKPNKKKPKKAVAGILSIALASSLIGGIAGGAGVYTVLDKDSDGKKVSSEGEAPSANTENLSALSGSNTAAIVQSVAPAVVGVSTKSVVNQSNGFFTMPKEVDGIGSGFIINDKGDVITNYHVIEGATEVKVILSTGEEVNAKVVNSNAQMDVALLTITDKNVKLPGVAKLGDSSKVVSGEDVIAIGNPLGKEFSSTVTKGIVSSANRKISTDESGNNIVEYIQTDAAINPGNSGGPLINSKGEVIGINTAKKVGQEIEGIGFAIPINKVKDQLDVLSKPAIKIGIAGMDVTEEVVKAQNERGNKIEEGILVKEVEDFSAAQKAGIRPGDIIVSFNGQKVKSVNELNELKGKLNVDQQVKVVVLRDGNKVTLDLKLTY